MSVAARWEHTPCIGRQNVVVVHMLLPYMTTHIVSLWLLKYVHRTQLRGQGDQSDNAVDLMLNQNRQAHHMVSNQERLSCVGLPEVYLSSYEAIASNMATGRNTVGEDTDVPPRTGLYSQNSPSPGDKLPPSYLPPTLKQLISSTKACI
jgi:hypothetical protein